MVVELKIVFEADYVGIFLPPCEISNVCDVLLFAFIPLAKESRLVSCLLVYIQQTNYPYLLTYLLTHWMVHSPSGAANWFAATQEIPRISQNPKVHYRTHKRPPLVSILGPSNTVHIPTSYLLEIHPNIIHPSTSRSPQWSLSLRFPHQDPIHPLSSPIRATFPDHLCKMWIFYEPRWVTLGNTRHFVDE